ncbi:ATP-grasp domain-containing protein [Pseudanabaena sp. FACHB-1277]|uniref:ATP-grasp domain-containing protein n=1 Tax=Pseudanabaena cinerea FACHB-1277 TaxID=2949581 RepID=A0A926UX44_9CYAN|nr:YheC/YheD family protein [Pseudanabaena cinerea]MBD2152639.1 ATP-grasp domain-containing protein [Pseudanabaena cinerea FACHB-1277]
MLTNIKMLLEACQNRGIAYEILHPNQNLVRVTVGDRDYYFTNYSTPLTSQSIAEIFKDKQYFYQIFHDVVSMPRTAWFISPYCNEKYREYLQFTSIADIVSELDQKFAKPMIIKRNRGSGGNNVFLCDNISQVQEALERIFDVESKSYDYVALVQEPISIVKEYRCVCLNHQVLLTYDKDFSQAKFVGNLSPLHWEGAIARPVTDPQILEAIAKFIQPLFIKMPTINYVGLDVACDDQNNYWLIEANSHPNFDIFIRDNGSQAIVELFEKMLYSLANLQ